MTAVYPPLFALVVVYFFVNRHRLTSKLLLSKIIFCASLLGATHVSAQNLPYFKSDRDYKEVWSAYPYGTTSGDPVADFCMTINVGIAQSVYYRAEEFVSTEAAPNRVFGFFCVDDDGQTVRVEKECLEIEKGGTAIRGRYLDKKCPVAPCPSCDTFAAAFGGNMSGAPSSIGEGVSVGNPTLVADGTKIESAVDWVSTKDPRFVLQRFYRSRDTITRVLYSNNANESGYATFGGVWMSGFDALVRQGSSTEYAIHAPDGYTILMTEAAGYSFSKNNFGWKHTASSSAISTTYGSRYVVYDGRGKKIFFGAGALDRGLREIEWPDGYRIIIQRDPATNAILSVADNKRQRMEFVHSTSAVSNSANPFATTVRVDSDYDGVAFDPQIEFEYSYDENSRFARFPTLLSVVETNLQVSVTRLIHKYEYGADSTFFPPMLTKVFDGRRDSGGNLYPHGIFNYQDGSGQVLSTANPLGANAYTFKATSDQGVSELSSLEATNSFGVTETYSYAGAINSLKPAGYTIEGPDVTNGPAKAWTWDSGRNLAESFNSNGKRTVLERDIYGRVLKRTEDADGAFPRVTQYTWPSYTAWSPRQHIPLSRKTPELLEEFIYSGDLVSSYTRTDTKIGSPTNGQTRTVSFVYTTLTSGLKVLTTVDGPGLNGDGVNDVTNFTYTAEGLLASTTDPNGLVTMVLARDVRGLPTSVQQSDGNQWAFTYDLHGRLETSAFFGPAQAAQSSSYTYDVIGQLLTYTNSLGKTWTFYYDEARRLTKSISPTGEKMLFSYDTLNNLTRTEFVGNGPAIRFFEEADFNGLSQITKTLQATGDEWAYSHDVEDNLLSVTDPLNFSTSYAYDGLNRVIETVDRENFSTSMEYNAADQLTEYTDPREIETTFTYNGFGEVIQEVSADRGTTTYTYDRRGLVTTRTDGRGVTIGYEYDHGGRLTRIDHPVGGLPDTVLTYDQPELGVPTVSNKGHVSQIDDGTIVTLFGHELTATGSRTTSEASYPSARVYTVTEEGDTEGNVTLIRYPSGREVHYEVDDDNRITRIRLKDGATFTNIVSQIAYEPYGPIKSQVFGDGFSQTLTYNQSYQPTGVVDSSGAMTLRQLAYDHGPRGNLTEIDDLLTPTNSESFVYTPRESLQSATGPYGAQAYSYDGVGNRVTYSANGSTDTYIYPVTSNRLQTISLGAGGLRAYTYDAAGNTLTDTRGAGYSYTYDSAGRMASMSINGVLQGQYRYDFAGRQAIRTLTSTGQTLHSVFDASGNRIAEYDQNSGALLREYVWNGLTPVAVIEGGAVYFIRTDHIGKPVFATDALGTKVWQVSYDPFGGVVASTGTPQNIRFPGQWFQSESGLHQNWMRDYDPTTGRYLQADPLGLVAGASVYGYARQNPNKFIDHNGEFPWVIPVVIFGLGLLLDVLSDEDGCIEPVEWIFYIFRNLPPLRPLRPFLKHNGGSGKPNFEPNPKHDTTRPGVSPQPKNPQKTLDNSVPVGGNSNARIGYDKETGEIVVFREHTQGNYHGYSTEWGSLTQRQKNAMIDAGIFSPNGRPL